MIDEIGTPESWSSRPIQSGTDWLIKPPTTGRKKVNFGALPRLSATYQGEPMTTRQIICFYTYFQKLYVRPKSGFHSPPNYVAPVQLKVPFCGILLVTPLQVRVMRLMPTYFSFIQSPTNESMSCIFCILRASPMALHLHFFIQDADADAGSKPSGPC